MGDSRSYLDNFLLLLIGKIYLWACRRIKELPSIRGLKSKVKLKHETEKYISTKK